ncbi:MAG: amidohydrolase family protein [Pseudomonadota bacterium]
MLKTIFVIAMFLLIANSHAASKIIHAGHLIDVHTGEILENQSIVIEGNQVTEVVEGFTMPEGVEVIDLSDQWVMPGLMDMHVHFDSNLDPPTSYSERYYLNPSDIALRGSVNANRTLLAGFTTVRDLGATSVEANLALRDAINRGYVTGPRIFAAGKSIATTGGHADPTNGIRRDLRGDPGPKEGVINGPDDAYKAVRQRYKDGSDVIKLTVTGGVLSLAKSGDNPQFTDEELEAIVEAAGDYNFVVAVHAHGIEGMKRAIRAGVHSVEHGTYMDQEAMRMMRKAGIWYVPTISAGKWVAELSKQDGKFPAVVRPKAAAVGPQIQDTFAAAWEAGVPIAFGTDAGVSPHGANAKEFEFMVEAGMPELEALRSATVNAAKLLREEDKLGLIAAGSYADIVAVPQNPLEDIAIMNSVSFVMKDGEVVKANPNAP